MVRLAFLALVLVACNKDKDSGSGVDDSGDTVDDSGTTASTEDADGDGYSPADGDCDDENPDVSPEATEVWYDGIDQDCDGIDDDQDFDGFGIADDCDDQNSGVNPDAIEICDGADDDCDGEIDEEATDGQVAYADADADGYGDQASTTLYCGEVPAGYTTDTTDCDDTRATVHPGAPEICDDVDNDCDGSVNEDSPSPVTWYSDADGDGYGTEAATTISCDQPEGYALTSDDCDDADATVNPGAEELCDDVDRNCDGDTTLNAVDGGTYFLDTDGDGFGDPGNTVIACEQPADGVNDGSDCDDTSAASFPGAVETCDGLDNDCNGAVDDGQGVTATYYADVDGDGYGDDTSTLDACAAPTGYVEAGGDCNDADATASPVGTEVCDGADNDCDGLTDEDGAGTTTWYADNDGDGYGDTATALDQCAQPTGYVAESGDCDDTQWTVSPAGIESCDGVDNDCDGTTDEADAAGAPTWYTDADGDTYGDPIASYVSCDGGTGSANASDCDDTNAATNPGAAEVCDGGDNDCDGTADEDLPSTTYYADADLDGHGDPIATVDACAQPEGTATTGDDCDDTNAAISPEADETCNGIDDNCDGQVDDASAVDGSVWYADADGDAYGNAASVVLACSAPSGYVGDATDCDDGSAAVNPGATELCNGADDDCDGAVDDGAIGGDTWYADADSDGFGSASSTTTSCSQPTGYVADSSDCDDGSATVFPGATELCNSVDDDCDGTVDDGATGGTWYADADGDTFGDPVVSVDSCSQPSGYVADSSDCDDADAAVNPDADEICNGLDDNCTSGTTDEAGTVAYEDTSGVFTDETATLAAGTAADPTTIGDSASYDLTVSSGTLHVCEGTWYVKVVTGSGSTDLDIVGEAGADSTILTTGGTTSGVNGSVVSVTSGIVNLTGVTITGGKGSSGTNGGGVIVGEYTARQAVPNMTITDSIITANSTQYGGGIALYNYGWVDLVDTLVDGNTATVAGGGLWVQNYGYLSCSASTLGAAGFVGNTSPIGAGGYYSSSAGGALDTVGCDWGDTGTSDDNSTYDLQWNPRSTHYWCYGDASSLSDTVSCSSGSCTASTEACP